MKFGPGRDESAKVKVKVRDRVGIKWIAHSCGGEFAAWRAATGRGRGVGRTVLGVRDGGAGEEVFVGAEDFLGVEGEE